MKFNNRDYQVNNTVSTQYSAPVPVGLFGIMIMLLYSYNIPVPEKNSKIGDGCIVKRRKDHCKMRYAFCTWLSFASDNLKEPVPTDTTILLINTQPDHTRLTNDMVLRHKAPEP